MSHSEICPVCKGKGKKVKAVEGSIKTENISCHGCEGKGWITIHDNNIQWYPSYPQPVPIPSWPIYPDPNQPTWTCPNQPTWTCTSKEV